ncbi:UDP-N-acetylenolpyruvoylglucosamine reductase [Candidatus Gottesmanbacteria bacterium RBG_16_43_7]|uniref:UDP-N-acetylenolpyruvoylglucosamine reductase n=1 Tax=Candidatus Gottesmanbacteria bacterium RBG_16_43_7 TaxID=1798373 RepID=A0A1F5Z845_9BACT|nr:MAG: UDP-N-acetylenolpyruvoylglucosamine reductase [Candidatus Gottesmanbacteria bacterium RBG_16_43_7]
MNPDIGRTLKQEFGSRLEADVSLSKYTTFKIGGNAQYFLQATSRAELTFYLKRLYEMGIPVFILGGGSNILISDKGISGVVIKNNTRNIQIKGMKGRRRGARNLSDVYLDADSGVIMNQLVRFTIEQGLAGLHMHLGLPGTVGGALYMNSKWTRPEAYVGDILYQAEIIGSDGRVRIEPRSYFKLAYDYSIMHDTHDIVLGATFRLTSANTQDLWRQAEESMAIRKSTQPQGLHSAGCIFKNISHAQALSFSTPNHSTSAGFLIDHAGCIGLKSGNAEVSAVHANFIVNRSQATASDIRKLIVKIKDKVKAQFGIELEEEIRFIGDF